MYVAHFFFWERILWVKNRFEAIDSSNQSLVFQHIELSYLGFFVFANHTAGQESAILCIIPSKPEHKEAEKRLPEYFKNQSCLKAPLWQNQCTGHKSCTEYSKYPVFAS